MATNLQNMIPNVNFPTPSKSNLRGYLFLIIAVGLYGTCAFFIVGSIHISINLIILFSIIGTFFMNLGFISFASHSLTQKSENRTEVQDASFQTLVSLTEHLQEIQQEDERRIAVLRQELQSATSSFVSLEKEVRLEEEQNSKWGWQEQAAGLIEEDPEAASLIAWIGLEQEIRHALNRLKYPTQVRNENSFAYLDRNLGSVIVNSRVLCNNDYITEESADEIVKMFNVRNRLIRGEEISRKAVVEFVQDAIRIAKEISGSDEI